MLNVKALLTKTLESLLTKTEVITLNSGFTSYDLGSKLTVYKNGNVVNLRGVVKPTEQIAAGGTANIATLPAKYRPLTQYACGVMQGSGHNRWWCQVRLDGTVRLERHANSTGATAITTSMWLPICLTWIVGGGE